MINEILLCDNYIIRIFVGTWNVAGKSPVGSLAVDLDEWLNLKDAADMYVLGYVIIVGHLNVLVYILEFNILYQKRVI
jgi:hypothetical protein